MKKLIVVLLLIISSNTFSQSNVSPQFSELKGMEDQFSNTHLFYRIYLYQPGGPIGDYFENSIYHLDLGNSEDTLFLFEGGRIGDQILRIIDIEYWNNNPAEFIYLGEGISTDPVAFIKRFDSFGYTFQQLGEAFGLELGKQNDSLIIASAPYLIKSSDGGFNWLPFLDSAYMKILSISPHSDNEIFFGGNGYDLEKTADGGLTISLVDTNHRGNQFFYDADLLHIYSLGTNDLIVSNNKGNAFSWTYNYTSTNRIYISPDYSQSGKIYLADGKRIYVSTDYGSNFSLYKSLDRKIVGIYKKPNSNKLYAATKYKIYEITPDTVQVIKSLPIADEELKFYPLAIGNKWVYDTWGWWWDGTIYHTYSGITYREVIGDTILDNGQFYYKLFDPTTFNYPYYLFERIDSSSGKVFRYDSTLGLPNNEYLIDDLFAELGDTVWSSRHQYQDFLPFICVGQGNFNKWGIHGSRKILTIFDLTGYTYSLSQGVGIDSMYNSFDFGENFITLKGCIIDGVIYGDTTTVGVEDEETPIATTFKLEQNYPNPFNPSTKIKFTILSVETTRRVVFTTLKVYDILGNEVATLVNEEKQPGTYEVEFYATSHSGEVRNLVSGIYFYQLKAGNFIQTKKMILLK
jgi:hypothetical protein